MGTSSNDTIGDVRSVVEAIATDSAESSPLYQVESLCMRCQQNVPSLSFFSHTHTVIHIWCMYFHFLAIFLIHNIMTMYYFLLV